MISSKELLDITGISRATLNNYVQLGVLPRPEVLVPEGAESVRALGYFPDDALDKIHAVQKLKARGMAMPKIATILSHNDWESEVQHQIKQSNSETSKPKGVARRSAGRMDGDEPKTSSAGMRLSLDSLPHPAYMINYNMELIWVNESAKWTLLPAVIPSASAQRNIFSLMASPEAGHSIKDQRALAELHLKIAAQRVKKEALAKIVVSSEPDLLPLLSNLTLETPEELSGLMHESLQLTPNKADGGGRSVTGVYFREGVLVIHTPSDSAENELMEFLGRRDQVINSLLKQRLPVMTQLAVLVADLQSSVQICSELPPDEYFQLVNQIWSTVAPVLRKYYGTSGKHVGDGVVHYFFPHPESNYLFNAIACAQEIRQVMRQLSKEWQIKKNWTRELYLNIGLHEGQEWLGAFQTANHVEFAVLGDTINHAARVSDLARNGTIWATKNLVTRLSVQEREQVEFGIHRENEDGRDRFIESSYAQVQSLVDLNQGKFEKFRDIANLAITEIRRVAPRSQGF